MPPECHERARRCPSRTEASCCHTTPRREPHIRDGPRAASEAIVPPLPVSSHSGPHRPSGVIDQRPKMDACVSAGRQGDGEDACKSPRRSRDAAKPGIAPYRRGRVGVPSWRKAAGSVRREVARRCGPELELLSVVTREKTTRNTARQRLESPIPSLSSQDRFITPRGL